MHKNLRKNTMKKYNNKSGFTLIEIIVVLIIVGVLAAIALPNLFSNIAKGKGGQALVSLDNAKTMMESYYTLHSGQTPASADMGPAGAPTSAAISGVTFTLSIPAAANGQNATSGNVVAAPTGNVTASSLAYSVEACDGGAGLGNCLVLNRASTGAWTCSSPTGAPYAGLC
jgi:type IV pilus assembly protein PilA